MKSTAKVLISLLAGGYLAGCATTAETVSKKSTASIKLAVKPSSQADLIQANSAAQYHEIGRSYHQKGNLDMATIAYQKALKLDEHYTPSMTALGSIFAEAHLTLLAIPLFEKVVALDPSVNHYNNLGYAYYLAERYEEANRVLKQALVIDPSYSQAQRNLDLVALNLANNAVLAESPSDTPVVVINNVNNKVVDNPVILPNVAPLEVQTQASLTALNDPIKPQATTEIKPKDVLVKRNVAVYDLQLPLNADLLSKDDTPIKTLKMVSQSQALPSVEVNDAQFSYEPLALFEPAYQLAHKSIPQATLNQKVNVLTYGAISFKHKPVLNKLFDTARMITKNNFNNALNVKISVINGNGLKGIARAVANQLAQHGIQNVVTADAKRFNKAKTHIEYRTGYRDDAVYLNHSLLNKPFLVRNDKLPKTSPVQLVLGRDLTGWGS